MHLTENNTENFADLELELTDTNNNETDPKFIVGKLFWIFVSNLVLFTLDIRQGNISKVFSIFSYIWKSYKWLPIK